MDPTLVCVDPGRSGAIGWWKTGMADVSIRNMPATDQEAVRLLCEIDDSEPNLCILGIEKPPRFTGKLLPASRVALLFQNYGSLLGAALALRWEVRLFPPKTWQKTFGLGSSAGLERAEWKGKLKAEAIGLYPRMKVTNDNADALLILHHLRKVLASPLVVAEEDD